MKIYAIIELSKERNVSTVYLSDIINKMKNDKIYSFIREMPNVKVQIISLVRGKRLAKKVTKDWQLDKTYNLYFYQRIY